MNNILLMSFLDESETYVLGFECGQLWEKISNGEVMEDRAIHTKNKQQIIMMCESFGCDFEITDYDEEWCFLTIKSLSV